ncbi:MAG: cytochrome c [Bacteroidia bacterium]|nr:cytochrome c [Bacteroidia bacterium]
MKKIILPGIVLTLLWACGGNSTRQESGTTTAPNPTATTENGNPSYDPDRGMGKFTHVDIPATIDAAMAESGKKEFEVKCSSCHKLSDEKLVGPGWKGVTARHTAEWIMNFVTNTDEMLDKDPKAQAMLEICLVRMPNQNVSDKEARDLYEFMRQNDQAK